MRIVLSFPSNSHRVHVGRQMNYIGLDSKNDNHEADAAETAAC